MTDHNANGVPMPRDLNLKAPWQRRPEDYEPEEIPALTEAHIADPLRSIATLILALPCNQMWRMVGDEGMRKPELDKLLVAWAEAYLEGQPMADLTQGRRA